MPTQDERDLGRLVYRGIQATDAVFRDAAQEIASFAAALPDGPIVDTDRRRLMHRIDRVLDRSFGATQSAALRSDLTRTIIGVMDDAATLPFARSAQRMEAILRNDPLYRGLYGPIVDAQRARRAQILDPNRRWVDSRGYRLSDRVWKQGRHVRRQIDAILREGMRRGQDAVTVARSLEAYLDPAYAPTQYQRNGRIVRRNMTALPKRPGVVGEAVYGSSFARTLARTEITRVHGLATVESAKVTPGNRGIRWRLSAGHTDQDVCNDLASRDGYGLGPGVYPVDQVPTYPQHPNDCCCLLPVMASRDDVINEILAQYGG